MKFKYDSEKLQKNFETLELEIVQCYTDMSRYLHQINT
jgi:hypothetical protein